jgi:excisionase family DNA binding protein
MNLLNPTNIPLHNQPGLLLDKYVTVQATAKLTGYNLQYLRRLLRAGRLMGVKVGQVWLIELAALIVFLEGVQSTQDRRFGPQGLKGSLNVDKRKRFVSTTVISPDQKGVVS